MITDCPDLKSMDAEENKREIRNWMAENAHVPPMFLVPFLMHKTIIKTAEVLIKVREAKKKGSLLRTLKYTTVIFPK